MNTNVYQMSVKYVDITKFYYIFSLRNENILTGSAVSKWSFRVFSEINQYNHPYQIVSRIMKYQSFVINILNLLGALYLISINLFLILISKLVTLTPETAKTLNMFIRLRVMLLRAI